MYSKRNLISLFALGIALVVYAQEPAADRRPGLEPTEVQHAEKRITIPGDTHSPDSIVEVRSLEVRTFIDTLRSVEPREHIVTIPPDSSQRKGHYVEFHLGGGLGSAGYGLLRKDLVHASASGYEQAGISGVVQLQYAYFFHKNVGIGIGAWLSEYTSHGYLQGDFVFPGQWDSDLKNGKSEQYTHHADIRNWHERQTIHNVGVPVSLQIQAWGKRNKAGFFTSLGAAPAYAVWNTYHVLNGEIEHWGEYPQRDAEIHDMHEFGTIGYTGTQGKLTLRQFTATAFIDLGLLVRMSPHTDFLLGVYGHYTILNMQQDAPLTDIGWNTDRFPNLNMQPYKGILATNCLAGDGALHPWQAGVKLGVHWHSIEKPRTSSVMQNDTILQMVARHDSVWTSRYDTLERQSITIVERVQRRIDKLNRIYFTFDSYQMSEKSQLFLDQIAEQLKTVPNKVIIGGHASKEGTRAHNTRLAKNRAMAVKNYLVEKGVPANRLIVKNYGSDVANSINVNKMLYLDRRVEIIVLDK